MSSYSVMLLPEEMALALAMAMALAMALARAGLMLSPASLLSAPGVGSSPD